MLLEFQEKKEKEVCLVKRDRKARLEELVKGVLKVLSDLLVHLVNPLKGESRAHLDLQEKLVPLELSVKEVHLDHKGYKASPVRQAKLVYQVLKVKEA